jgi:hypothetical protein
LSCLAPAPLCSAPPSSLLWLCRPVVVPTPLVVCCGPPRRHPVHGSSPFPSLLVFLLPISISILCMRFWLCREQCGFE